MSVEIDTPNKEETPRALYDFCEPPTGSVRLKGSILPKKDIRVSKIRNIKRFGFKDGYLCITVNTMNSNKWIYLRDISSQKIINMICNTLNDLKYCFEDIHSRISISYYWDWEIKVDVWNKFVKMLKKYRSKPNCK